VLQVSHVHSTCSHPLSEAMRQQKSRLFIYPSMISMTNLEDSYLYIAPSEFEEG